MGSDVYEGLFLFARRLHNLLPATSSVSLSFDFLVQNKFFFPARNSLLVSKNIAVIATTNNPSLVRLLIKYSSNILAAKSREIIIHADLMVFPPFFFFLRR